MPAEAFTNHYQYIYYQQSVQTSLFVQELAIIAMLPDSLG